MNAILQTIAQHSTAILSGTMGTLVFSAVARHLPRVWPITLKDVWFAIVDTVQEIANQRSGAANPSQNNPK